MKKLIVILALCGGLLTSASAQTVWRELTFEQALEAAKAEGKPVFLDCYTSWCSPCRQMAQRVFPTAEVGDFLNGKFVAIKMDMEKGEGVPLAARYDVTVFPTYLVIDADGKMMHKAIGAIEGAGFINLISAAFDPARALGARLARFDAGDRDPDFLRELHSYLLRINDARAAEVAASVKSGEWRVKGGEWSDVIARSPLGRRGNLKANHKRKCHPERT